MREAGIRFVDGDIEVCQAIGSVARGERDRLDRLVDVLISGTANSFLEAGNCRFTPTRCMPFFNPAEANLFLKRDIRLYAVSRAPLQLTTT